LSLAAGVFAALKPCPPSCSSPKGRNQEDKAKKFPNHALISVGPESSVSYADSLFSRIAACSNQPESVSQLFFFGAQVRKSVDIRRRLTADAFGNLNAGLH